MLKIDRGNRQSGEVAKFIGMYYILFIAVTMLFIFFFYEFA